jgi:hypothetical protein
MSWFVGRPDRGICDPEFPMRISAARKGRGLISSHGAILLGEVAPHLATIHVSCKFCPRRGKASG